MSTNAVVKKQSAKLRSSDGGGGGGRSNGKHGKAKDESDLQSLSVKVQKSVFNSMSSIVQRPKSSGASTKMSSKNSWKKKRKATGKPYEPIRLPKDILTIQAHSASTPVTELPYLLIAAHIGALPSTRQFYPTTTACRTPLTVFRDMFVMTMDVRGYKASSVRLSTEGRLIIIECLQSEVPQVEFTQTGTVDSEDKYIVDPSPNISTMPVHTSFNYTQHRVKLPVDFSEEGLKVGLDEVTGHVVITGRLVHNQTSSFPELWNKEAVLSNGGGRRHRGPLINTSNSVLNKEDARKLAAWSAVQSQSSSKAEDVTTTGLLQYGRKQWLEREGAKLRALQHQALKENIRKITEMKRKATSAKKQSHHHHHHQQQHQPASKVSPSSPSAPKEGAVEESVSGESSSEKLGPDTSQSSRPMSSAGERESDGDAERKDSPEAPGDPSGRGVAECPSSNPLAPPPASDLEASEHGGLNDTPASTTLSSPPFLSPEGKSVSSGPKGGQGTAKSEAHEKKGHHTSGGKSKDSRPKVFFQHEAKASPLRKPHSGKSRKGDGSRSSRSQKKSLCKLKFSFKSDLNTNHSSVESSRKAESKDKTCSLEGPSEASPPGRKESISLVPPTTVPTFSVGAGASRTEGPGAALESPTTPPLVEAKPGSEHLQVEGNSSLRENSSNLLSTKLKAAISHSSSQMSIPYEQGRVPDGPEGGMGSGLKRDTPNSSWFSPGEPGTPKFENQKAGAGTGIYFPLLSPPMKDALGKGSRIPSGLTKSDLSSPSYPDTTDKDPGKMGSVPGGMRGGDSENNAGKAGRSEDVDRKGAEMADGTESGADLHQQGKLNLEEFRDLIAKVVAADNSDEEESDPVGEEDKSMWEKLLKHARDQTEVTRSSKDHDNHSETPSPPKF